MALSITVRDELKNLQFYFKKLYFLRFFIPSAMKVQLRTLETIDLEVTNEDRIKSILGLLCASFVRPGLYARFILFCFSGLGRFASGAFMHNVKELANNDLFSQDNIAFMASYDPLTTGLEGLQLLQKSGLKPVDKHYERLAQMMRVTQLKLVPDLSAQFYKAIAAQPALRDYATEIRAMIAVKACYPYVHKLVSVQNISDYRKAIMILAQENLLPEMVQTARVIEQQEARMKQTIVMALETHPLPSEIAEAVVALRKNGQLEELAFEQVKVSAAPVDLAKLIGEFSGLLDQRIWSRLEQHRRNLADMSMSNHIVISAAQRLDVDYCQTLIDLLSASHPFPVSQPSRDMYDDCYARLKPDQRASLVQKWSAFIRTDALSRPWGQVFVDFLKLDITGSHFFVYMELCTALASRADFVTAENAGEIIMIIQQCAKPDELWKRLAVQKNEISVGFLRSLVVHINPQPQHKISPVHHSDDTSSTASDGSGLRHRNISNGNTMTTPLQSSSYAQPGADLENGVVQEKRKPLLVTPYSVKRPVDSARGGWGILGSVAGALGSLMWRQPDDTAAAKKDDDKQYGMYV